MNIRQSRTTLSFLRPPIENFRPSFLNRNTEPGDCLLDGWTANLGG